MIIPSAIGPGLSISMPSFLAGVRQLCLLAKLWWKHKLVQVSGMWLYVCVCSGRCTKKRAVESLLQRHVARTFSEGDCSKVVITRRCTFVSCRNWTRSDDAESGADDAAWCPGREFSLVSLVILIIFLLPYWKFHSSVDHLMIVSHTAVFGPFCPSHGDSNTTTHNNCFTALCPGLNGWAGTMVTVKGIYICLLYTSPSPRD